MTNLRSKLALCFFLTAFGASVITAIWSDWRLGSLVSHSGLVSATTGNSQPPVSTSRELHDIHVRFREETAALIVVLGLALYWSGHWVSGEVMAPMVELTVKLNEIDVENLHTEIDVPNASPELAEVIRHIKLMLNRLIKALDDTRSYAAEVAHELRTPLHIIGLKLESSQGRIEPALSESLQEEIQRLRHVVEQVLLIAKAGRGRLTSSNCRLNVADLTAEVVEDFRLLAESQDRELTFTVADSPHIEADKQYFRQILHALLTNALLHGVGEIRVRIRSHKNEARLYIGNRVGLAPGSKNLTLGLGLRVVQALLGTMPHRGFRRFSCPTLYGVLIRFPQVEAEGITNSTTLLLDSPNPA